jgi:hypothetical protein
MTFSVQGEGLQNIRVDFEAGKVRWKSPEIPVSTNQRQVTLSLKEFQRIDQNKNGSWSNSNIKGGPKNIDRVTIKTGGTIGERGATINTVDSTGTVTVRDITFK